jgi:cobalt-precorrin-5B (C1)-methyltransferase
MEKIEGRLGYTTGACAAAAGKAALACLLEGREDMAGVDIPFPNGDRHVLPLAFLRATDGGAEAGVVKDAGDDPDVTDGAVVSARVAWADGDDIEFAAGSGVGVVTKEGLSVPPGEPAINPGPREMIRAALGEVTRRPVHITVSISGGETLAKETYNPRLGIVGGLSVLGTTGRVRPFSCKALQCSVACELDVAAAAGVRLPVLVPGHIGERSVRKHLDLSGEQVIEVGNEWGYVLDRVPRYPFTNILVWGHPGKLAKLAVGDWDTHSSRSGSAVDAVAKIATDLGPPTSDLGSLTSDLGLPISGLASYTTTEGLFTALSENERRQLADVVSNAISDACVAKAGGGIDVAVVLVNMAGEVLGTSGDIQGWQWKR